MDVAGKKTIVYSCPFVPPEWIDAHGLQPSRILPRSGKTDVLTTVSFGVCPYAKAFIGEVIARKNIAGVIFTTLCDQMRRGSEFIGDYRKLPVFLLNVPATWQTPEAQKLYRSELERLGNFLVRLGGSSPSNARLTRTMLHHDQIRTAVKELLGKRSARHFSQAIAEFHATGKLKKETNDRPAPNQAIRLALVGGPMTQEDFKIFDLVEKSGGQIVLDGTETGERGFPKSFDRRRIHEAPLQELCDAYFGSIPDVSRRPNSELYQWFKMEFSRREIQGVLFRRYVWCDKWHAEFARFKKWAGIPVLDLDVGEDEGATENRTATRIQAFLEMLR